MELKRHTDEAASRVAAVLQRAEEQGHMIESLHTSVSPKAQLQCGFADFGVSGISLLIFMPSFRVI